MSGGIFGQSVVRIRAGVRTNRAGDQVADWTPAAVDRLAVDRLSVQPSTQVEEVDGVSDVRITGYRVLSEPGTTPDVTGLDRIEYGGHVYAVQGEVALWPDPDGADHIELRMRRVEGSP